MKLHIGEVREEDMLIIKLIYTVREKNVEMLGMKLIYNKEERRRCQV
jgi:hypothetical protein